ncbi:hypothetical protein EB651_20115 [Escherichia coli]|nr:hypothetical protein [Escherichia coli]
MKTLNIQVNDIAAISALGGSMLADIIAAQYKVIDDTKDASEMAMPCIAYGQIPANIGPGVFINRVYSMDSQSLSASQRYELFNGLATQAFTFFFQSGWYGAFRVVSFRDNGPAGLLNIGIVHDKVLNEFCDDFPRANVSETGFNCGMTFDQIRMFISDQAYQMPLYNNQDHFVKLAKHLAA